MLMNRWFWFLCFIGSLLLGARFSAAGNMLQTTALGKVALLFLVILVLLTYVRSTPEPLITLPSTAGSGGR